MTLNVLKDLWLLFGRLFPFPTRSGLRRAGNPGRSSPVLVTCNFELTVRKVVQALEHDHVDAWLLVAPTKGINVWCAAGGGHFTTDTVVSIIKTSGIESLVDHRQVILPQLSAVGVNVWALKNRTGWKPHFGPVDIKHLATYLNGGEYRADRQHRCVEFPFKERFIMGTNLAFNSLLFFIIPFLVTSILVSGLWWKSILLLFLLGVLNSVLTFWLPGNPGVQKGFSLGLLVSAVFVVISQTAWTMGAWATLGWTGWILMLSTYLGYDMPSWSPVWRADVKELVTGVKRTRVEVIPGLCTGCGLCTTVCPASVFEQNPVTKISRVVNLEACQACGACIENCPNEAIENNFRTGVCSCPTCTVINSVKSHKRKVFKRRKGERESVTANNCCDAEDNACSESECIEHQ